MLCITGNEKTAEELKSRFIGVAARCKDLKTDYIHEVRLDALTEAPNETFELISKMPNILLCCRPEREGGAFKGSEALRLALLRRGAKFANFIDIESDVSNEDIEAISKETSGEIILSKHFFDAPPTDIKQTLWEMASKPASHLKLALKVDDASQCQALLDAQTATQGKKTVLIAMGYAGLISRVRYLDFGSPWTYVAYDERQTTAPGQLSLETALEWGLPQAATAPFLALVGGKQIAHSPGAAVYNRIFRKKELNTTYIPVQSEHGAPTFDLLKQIGAQGLSVTMPLKDHAHAYGTPDEHAQAANTSNSLRFSSEATEATNTDIIGIREPLKKAIDAAQNDISSCLILGAGGAAKAAIEACRQLDLSWALSCRSQEKGEALLQGEKGNFIPWEQRAQANADVLINSTPITGALGSPWPENTPLKKKIVFDLALGDGPSLLLNQAHAEKADAIDAKEMWFAQGAAQIQWITDVELSAEDLKECQA